MKIKQTAIIAAVLLVFSSCSSGAMALSMEGSTVKSINSGITADTPSKNVTKTLDCANPLIANVFCADPTAVEYEGRLYVYGTNDHQQYDAVGSEGSNTYEHIKSLVMLSTNDMVNWSYHGAIDVGEISPYIVASWAPSITSRVEADGLTHFYLYYSNSGCGVGMLTATSPTGPWTDPIGKPLIDSKTKGLGICEAPFDPGVVIDDDGVGWLSFGGGSPNSQGSKFMPGNARIVRLGKDMASLDSEISEIKAPYHFEANELNVINGTYVYTYNTSWDKRLEWGIEGASRPASCSMAYMTTKTPLDTDSWKYQDYYLKNPGELGLEYSNNHTHLQKYNDKYYLFYHSLFPQKALGTDGGFRSLCVNEIAVDEDKIEISETTATKEGAEQIKKVNPYAANPAECMFTSADIEYISTDTSGNMMVSAQKDGGWTYVKGVDFSKGVAGFAGKVSGKGRIDVYIDDLGSKKAASIGFNSKTAVNVYKSISKKITGEHNVYFVISGENVCFDEWQFTAKS